MRQTIDPEAPRLCNGCAEKEKHRVVKEKKEDNTVGILVKCPKSDYQEIEEHCKNTGIDFSRYFLELHYGSQAAIELFKENQNNPDRIVEDKADDLIVQKPPSTKGKKK